jgi:hypothetical protein
MAVYSIDITLHGHLDIMADRFVSSIWIFLPLLLQIFLTKSVIFNTCKQRFRLLDNHRIWLRADPRNNTMKSRQLLKQPRLLIIAVFNNKITRNLYQFEFPVAVIFKIWTIWKRRLDFAPTFQTNVSLHERDFLSCVLHPFSKLRDQAENN